MSIADRAKISLTTLVATAALLGAPAPGAAQDSGSYEFFAIGDMPYGWPDAKPGWERLIATVNGARPAFTVHIGDFKRGGEPCTDDYFQMMAGYFDSFEQPFVYTPGDNEWTDCHRKSAGAYDPGERLGKLRQLFFKGPDSLGRQKLRLARQSETKGFEKYPENARWSRGPVTFATVHVVGSNNNLTSNLAAAQESIARTAADLIWLQEAFKAAKRDRSKGVVIFMQADPFFEKWADDRSGVNPVVEALETRVQSFPGQVLLVHGDTHQFRIDKPMKEKDRPLLRFTRLEVLSEQEMLPVGVRVDPADPGLFSFRVLHVPGNVPAAAPASN